MASFWLMYLVPSLAALLANENSRGPRRFPWIFTGFFFVFAIGLRYQVGGDWYNYLTRYDLYAWQPLREIIASSDPGYVFVNWIAAQSGLGIYGVNLICGAIFITGLFVFCRQQQRVWLALTVTVPYLMIVVAMGYTRQSVALGFLFLALACLEQGGFKRFLMFIAAAALFHKTALLMIPIGIFLNEKRLFMRVIAVLICGYVLWDLMLADQQASLWKNYVDAQMESSGAMIRVLMNLVPALIFLVYRKRWREHYSEYWFWFLIALGCLVSVVLVDFASTAVDRVALYFIPLQVVVWSRLPTLVGRQISPRLVICCIILFYGAVLFVWLNFASHNYAWLPYRNVLFL